MCWFKALRDLNVCPHLSQGNSRPSMWVSMWFFKFLDLFPVLPHNVHLYKPSWHFSKYWLICSSSSWMLVEMDATFSTFASSFVKLLFSSKMSSSFDLASNLKKLELVVWACCFSSDYFSMMPSNLSIWATSRNLSRSSWKIFTSPLYM